MVYVTTRIALSGAEGPLDPSIELVAGTYHAEQHGLYIPEVNLRPNYSDEHR